MINRVLENIGPTPAIRVDFLFGILLAFLLANLVFGFSSPESIDVGSFGGSATSTKEE
jgi:hypothetical protein